MLFFRHYLSPLQNFCCFIHSIEAHCLTDVVLYIFSQYLDFLVWFLSIQLNHLVLVVLFCLLSHWCCLVYQSKPLVSLLLFYIAFRSTLRYWCCFVCCLSGFVDSPESLWFSFIFPLEILYLCGAVLSTLTKHILSHRCCLTNLLLLSDTVLSN